MKIIYRRILFWIVFILFIISTPLVIMHSKGYRFDQTRGIFVYSGSITLKTIPSSVRIFIDDQAQDQTSLDIINNSITLNGLKPGTYQIRVEADGYQSWEKQVEVHSGLSTEFWNVVLVPKNREVKEISSQNSLRFFPSPFAKKIAFVEDLEKNISLWVTDFNKNESHAVYSASNVSFSKNKRDNLEWNFKEDLMLLPVSRKEKNDYLVVSATQTIDPLFLSDVFGFQEIEKARWSPQNKNVIYFLANETGKGRTGLFQINLDDNSQGLVVSDVAAYDLSKSSIYYIQENSVLFKSDLDGTDAKQINSSRFTDESVGKNARLIVYDDDRQALLLDRGELFFHNNGIKNVFQKIGDEFEGVQFSDDGKKLLLWSDNEISVLFLRKWDVQPYREENEIQNLIRLSSSIENVFWYRDYEHVFFSQNKKIKLLELDSRDHRIVSDILENNIDDFPATYDAGNGYYFFVKNLGEDKKIYYFLFPEVTGFFG